MSNRDDDFDTEIDQRPLQPAIDAPSTSASKLRTAIDHDLAKRLLQAFPERFNQAKPSASPNDAAAGNRLPRTVLQAPLAIPAGKPVRDQDVFDAPVSPTDIPLARMGRAMRRTHTLLTSMRSSVRTLLGAILLAGVVGLGWWLSFTPTPVSQTLMQKRDRADTQAVSTASEPPKGQTRPPRSKEATSESASKQPAILTGPVIGETEAARAFIKGQRVEALNLYQRLFKQFPERKVYGVAIEVLQRSLQHSCNNGVTVKGEPCTGS